MHFTPGSGVRRTGPPVALAKASTILGPTNLVEFSSTLGPCVEVDHLPQRSRAGGCAFTPFPSGQSVRSVAIGYTDGVHAGGLTELFGQATPSVRSVNIDYRHAGAWHRTRVLLGRDSSRAKRRLPRVSWFAADVPGCLEGSQIRIKAFDADHALLSTASALDQHAACQAGSGYKVRGALVYGALPLS